MIAGGLGAKWDAFGSETDLSFIASSFRTEGILVGHETASRLHYRETLAITGSIGLWKAECFLRIVFLALTL
jgi:hypothetical protein